MPLFLTFISKEWCEIRQNRKTFILFVFSAALPFLCNMLARKPILPMSILAPFYVVISVCVVAEFVRASLIEELNSSTFDILLTAPFRKGHLIVCKTFLPIVFSFGVTVLGLLISDTLSILIPVFSTFETLTSFSNIIIAFLSCAVCGWTNFCIIIKTRKTSSAFHTFALATIILILGVVAVASTKYGCTVLILFSLAFLLFIYVYCNIMLVSPQPLKKKNATFYIDLFKGQNLCFFSSIIVKDIALIHKEHLLETAFYLSVAFFVKIPIVLYAVLFLTTTFGARKLLYPNLVEEKLNKTMDILMLRKNIVQIYSAKAAVPCIFSLLLSMLIITLSSLCVANLYLVIFVVLLSPLVIYPIIKLVSRPREIFIGNLVSSTILLALYLFVFFCTTTL